MNVDMEKISLFVIRLFELIGSKYPERTFLGIVLCGVFQFIAQVFQITDINIFLWLSLGLFFAHIPTWKKALNNNQVGDENIDKQIALIESANFTEAEKRSHYRKLIQQVQNEVILKEPMQKQLKVIQTESSKTDE